MSKYLPQCCDVSPDNAGGYEVQHTETSSQCRHEPSGGTSGRPDGLTPCNRIIGNGDTQRDAIKDARAYLGMD